MTSVLDMTSKLDVKCTCHPKERVMESIRCLQKNPAIRRYLRRFAIAMSFYIGLTTVVALYFHRFHPKGPVAYLLAVLPAIAIIGLIVTVGLYLAEEQDEFQRSLIIQAMLWGIGGVLAFTSIWGSLESFTHVPHFQPNWTFTLFWCFVGLGSPFLMRKYR
jgi:hypothetical protein